MTPRHPRPAPSGADPVARSGVCAGLGEGVIGQGFAYRQEGMPVSLGGVVAPLLVSEAAAPQHPIARRPHLPLEALIAGAWGRRRWPSLALQG